MSIGMTFVLYVKVDERRVIQKVYTYICMTACDVTIAGEREGGDDAET